MKEVFIDGVKHFELDKDDIEKIKNFCEYMPKDGDNKIPPTNKSTGLADQNPIEELGDKIAGLNSDKGKELGEYLGIKNE